MSLQTRLASLITAIKGDFDGIDSRLTSLEAINQHQPGVFFWWNGNAAPAGALVEDGSIISRTTYANLFNAIGTIYGVGDGSTTFAIPNTLGRVIRAVDNGSGIDPDAASRTDRGDGTTGDAVGTKQSDQFKSHSHGGVASYSANGRNGNVNTYSQLGGITDAAGGLETRMVNIGKLPCIWY